MAISAKRVRSLVTPIITGGCALAGGWAAWRYIYILNNPDALQSNGPIGRWIRATAELSNKQTFLSQLLVYITFIIVGALIGLFISNVVARQFERLENTTAYEKVALFFGFVLGLVVAGLVVAITGIGAWWGILLALVFSYLAVVATKSITDQIPWFRTQGTSAGIGGAASVRQPKLLDTNVIIDGRIADICKIGFVEGPIFIPRFVLEELQQIADSAEALKRARGRRGLDILNQMQKEMSLEVMEFEHEGPDEVDAKLVAMAQELKASVITNDFNLNKVAELQGVKVLNVNELANALKPVVLPGEEMRVAIIKEGKEQNQGIGYLDDGTMVVVESARRCIGETVHVVVTSVLQTVAGKMIFATLKSEHEEEEELIDRNIRSYSGSRPRKKIR